jgi:hypothetical protein
MLTAVATAPLLLAACSKLYWVGMRQSAAWGLYLVAGTTAHHACLALSFLLGGSMVYQGLITAEQLTSFMFYVQMVTSSSLAVCDQYGAVMEVRQRACCFAWCSLRSLGLNCQQRRQAAEQC